MLGLVGEGLEALADGLLVLLLGLLRRLRPWGRPLLLWRRLLLGEGEAGREAAGGGAVAGRGPHGRLQHLHGVAPLAGGGDVHLVEGRAQVGHGVGVGG